MITIWTMSLPNDLKELETALICGIKETDSKIELLRAETKRDIAETYKLIAETKAELVRWIVGAGLLQTSLTTPTSGGNMGNLSPIGAVNDGLVLVDSCAWIDFLRYQEGVPGNQVADL